MNFNLHVELLEMNTLKIESDGLVRYYDLNNWVLDSAIANFINDEILES